MSRRISHEVKEKIKAAFSSAQGTFSERAKQAFATVGLPLDPRKAYPSVYPWLGVGKRYIHAADAVEPKQAKKVRQHTAITLDDAVDLLADAIADAVLLRIEPKLIERIATAKPRSATPAAALSTRDKLLAELKAAKESGDRITVLRCVDKLRQLSAREESATRAIETDSRGED